MGRSISSLVGVTARLTARTMPRVGLPGPLVAMMSAGIYNIAPAHGDRQHGTAAEHPPEREHPAHRPSVTTVTSPLS
jgi:hypothetical protein